LIIDHPTFNIQNPTSILESDATLAGAEAEEGEAESEDDEGPDFGFGDGGAWSSFRRWEFYSTRTRDVLVRERKELGQVFPEMSKVLG